MKRRIIATLLAVMMLLSVPFVGVASATDGEATGLNIDEESLELALFSGYSLSVEFYGDYADLVWTVDDETVVELGYSQNPPLIRAVGVGTATVTVTHENSGLSDSCTITVAKPETINAVTGIQITAKAADNSIVYKLTPTETAEYAIWSELVGEGGDPYLEVYDAVGDMLANNDDSVASRDFKVLTQLEAGKDYYLYLGHFQDSEYTLNIAKAVEPTAIVLDESVYTAYIGDFSYMVVTFEPANAKEYPLAWSIADDSVAELWDYEIDDEAEEEIEFNGYPVAEIFGLEAGTTVLSVATESGLTASATIKVEPVPTLEENTLLRVTKGEEEWSYYDYTFTPKESGTYYVGTNNDDVADTFVSYIWTDEQGDDWYEWIEPAPYDTDDDTIALYTVELEAGTTYRFLIEFDFENTDETEADWFICDDLEAIPDCVFDSHDAGEGIVVLVPTNITWGEMLYTCKECGAEWVEEIKPVETESSAKVFNDVVEDKWYEEAVDLVYSSGLFKGVTETSFAPNGTMTRGMFVTVLGRLSGIAENKTATTKFTDVASGKYYTGYIAWANEAGIVNGVTDTTFAPDKNITREQICKMIVEYCNYADITLQVHRGTGEFTDAKDIGGWATGYVDACQKAGLINGIANADGSYRFNPKGNATRAQVATILMNLAELYL